MEFKIDGELTDLNTYITIERGSRYNAAKVKEDETYRCAMEARIARIGEVPEDMYPVTIFLTWYTKDLKKDVDNVTFAKKFILDGLVQAGVLQDDSRRYVRMITDVDILVDKHNPRIEVLISAS